MVLGMTAPTLITVSLIGMNQNQPRSGRVTMRMSPARRPSARGTPVYWRCTAMFCSTGSGTRVPKRRLRNP